MGVGLRSHQTYDMLVDVVQAHFWLSEVLGDYCGCALSQCLGRISYYDRWLFHLYKKIISVSFIN